MGDFIPQTEEVLPDLLEHVEQLGELAAHGNAAQGDGDDQRGRHGANPTKRAIARAQDSSSLRRTVSAPAALKRSRHQ